jgi:two-component system, LytTR family, response regulator
VKTLIIEDEQLAIDAINKLIERHADFIKVVGIARSGPQAIQLIEELRPELLFLDIDIPVKNGLEVLRQIDYQPHVVFTTAYNAYAVKAFELNSVDYLLKPIEQARFDNTMDRLRRLRSQQESTNGVDIAKALESYFERKQFTSVTVKIGDRVLFIPLDEITHFSASEKYVSVHTLGSKQHLTSFTLVALEEKLPSHFVRVSRAFIVNKNHIKEAKKLFSRRYVITLADADSTKVETGGKFSENFVQLIK